MVSALWSFTLVILVTGYKFTLFHVPCSIDQDCIDHFNEHYQCVEYVCLHEPLWPLNFQKAIGVASLIIVSAFANAGGIGGGAVIIPIYMYVFYYVVGEAIPLSKATIFAGAIANLFFIIHKRHPRDENSLIIDFRLSSIIVPMILAGTVVGVTLTKLFPPIIMLIFLLYYLTKTAISMYCKAKAVYAKETAEKMKENRKKSSNPKINLGCENEANQSPQPAEEDSSLCGQGPASEHLPCHKLYCIKRKTFCSLIVKSVFSILVCILAYASILITTLLRGGKGVDSIAGFKMCSFESWALYAAGQALCLLLGLFIYIRYFRNIPTKRPEEVLDENNIDKRTLFIKSYIAGIVAGSLGMGGGVVINPLLVKMGYNPEVASAVSGFTVFFTSFATTSQFLIDGAFDFKNALVILSFSFVGSFLGSFFINMAIKKYGRPSILIWIVFVMLILSGLALFPVGVIQIIKDKNIFEFNSPC